MQTHHKLIHDSTQPSNVPSGVLAVAYFLGEFAWPESEIRRMAAVYRLCEIQDPPVGIMHRCRGVGVEPGAVSLTRAVECCHERANLGFDDFTLYTSLDAGADTEFQPGMAGVIQALRSRAAGKPFRIHVADVDNNPDLIPEVDGVKAWAKQFHFGTATDLSALYGTDDLVRR